MFHRMYSVQPSNGYFTKGIIAKTTPPSPIPFNMYIALKTLLSCFEYCYPFIFIYAIHLCTCMNKIKLKCVGMENMSKEWQKLKKWSTWISGVIAVINKEEKQGRHSQMLYKDGNDWAHTHNEWISFFPVVYIFIFSPIQLAWGEPKVCQSFLLFKHAVGYYFNRHATNAVDFRHYDPDSSH